MRPRRWFQPPRQLLAVFLAMTLLSALALSWLGWRMIQQDRALEAQRDQERLELAADRAAAALQRHLAELGTEDIYVSDLDPATGKVTGPPVKVASRYVGANEGPSWSPDGRTLAYRSNRDTAPGLAPATIVLRNWSDGQEREIVTPPVRRFGWSTPVAW